MHSSTARSLVEGHTSHFTWQPDGGTVLMPDSSTGDTSACVGPRTACSFVIPRSLADSTDTVSNTPGERPPSANFQFGWWYAGAGQKFTGSGDMVLEPFSREGGPLFARVLPVRSRQFRQRMRHVPLLDPHSDGGHCLLADAKNRPGVLASCLALLRRFVCPA